MKIALVIASRGRPRNAIGVIESARILSSGEHEIEYVVGCDDDDPETAGFLESYIWPDSPGCARIYDITIDCGPRPLGPPAVVNRCIAKVDADIILAFPDDCIICTPFWDQGLAQIFRNHNWVHPDLACAALDDTANPGQGTLFAFTKRWHELSGGFEERFPFWFSDTALVETYSFITGQGLPIMPIKAANKPGVFNPRMREMPFWWKFYAATRKDRLEVAASAREALNLPQPPDLASWVEGWERRDASGLPESEKIAAMIKNPREPDEHYMRAKANAEAYMREKAA